MDIKSPDELMDIPSSKIFITVASKHKVPVTKKEADTLLGYMEGHDIALMYDKDYNLIAYDLQFPWVRFEEAVYPCDIKGLAEFSIEMAEDLLSRHNIFTPPSYAEDIKVLEGLLKKARSAETVA